ncbi:MAG: hypothetical protein EHM93_04170 [Bacteroidales bacterium]|nr:MAG: hypothetical protein EHM93_04170 [Bacteroidales bacterium]
MPWKNQPWVNFLLEFRYNARKPGVKEQIVEITINSSEVRGINYTL